MLMKFVRTELFVSRSAKDEIRYIKPSTSAQDKYAQNSDDEEDRCVHR